MTGYASTSPRRMPELIVTVALSRFGSVRWSMSMIVMFSLTIVSFPFSMYARLPASTSDSTGASFTGVTVTVRVTALLVKSPSLITNDTVRSAVVCVPVGSSDELEYVTARSAVCQAAIVALPLSDSAPLAATYVAVMPVSVPAYASTSPSTRPAVMVAVALSRLASSGS